MKKFLSYFLALTLCAGLWNCAAEYDDSDLRKEIEEIRTRLETLNEQVATLQTALAGGSVITKVEETADGYLITFSNGKSIAIKHGPAGDDGSKIGVKDEGGVLYWTLDGEFLLRPGTDEKIPVQGDKGDAGHSPRLEIDADGYWTVDGERITDAAGREVEAQGDSFFRDVRQTDDAVVLVLADGSEITIPKAVESSLSFAFKTIFVADGGSQTVSYTARNIDFVEIFSLPKSWSAEIDEKAGTVTVAAQAGAASTGERLVIAGADATGRTYMAAVKLYCGTLPAGGFFVYNEGQFGRMPASVNYYADGAWIVRPYATLNPDRALGNSGVKMVRSEVSDRIYLTAKDAPFVVETDAQLRYLSQLGSDHGSTVGQVMGMTVYDASTGYVTTQNGVYRIGLDPLSLDAADRIYEGRNGGRDICAAGGKVFFIFSNKVYGYDPTAADVAPAEICAAGTGFVTTSDGAVWAADSEQIVKIDPADNTFESIPTGDYPLWWESTYRPCELAAAPDGSAVYFLRKVGSGWSAYGKELCRCDPATGTIAPLWSLPEGFSAYGCGLKVDPATGKIYVLYTKDGWGANYLKTYVSVVAPDGTLEETIPYTSDSETIYWFPSEIAF